MEITLRKYQLSDVQSFMEWASDKEVIRYTRLNLYTSKQDALNYIEQVVIPHPWYYAICLEDKPIGLVMFKPGLEEDKHKGELGYALGSKYWGQGIMTRVLKMALPIVFKEFPEVVRIDAFVDVRNKASVKVLENVGFLKEAFFRKYRWFRGEWVDVFVYSILSTDPIPL